MEIFKHNRNIFRGLLLLLGTILLLPAQVLPAISNRYMTFFIPEYAQRYIYLESKFSYSLQLVLHKGDPPSLPEYLTNVTKPELVEFIVKAPEYSYYGIIAIIQSLHLRTNPFNPDDRCRDYIQFSTDDTNTRSSKGDNSAPSPKICGTLPRGDHKVFPNELLGPRTYFNPRGSIKLRMHVDTAVSHEDLAELNSIGAEIVFTAYTACPGTEVGLKTLKRCSKEESLSCIPSSLFCDSKVDCGFSEDFGLDEQLCYFPYLYAALAVIVIILFVLFIYGFMQWARLKAKRYAQNQSGRENYVEDASGDPAMCAVESVDMDASMGAF